MDFLDIYLTTFSESIISEIQKLWGSSFASKYLKFNLDFKNVARNWKKVFCFWGNCIWTGIVKLSLLRTGYFSFSANFLLGSTKIWHVNRREFFQLNWIGRGQWRFQQRLCTFTMLLFQGSSQTALFRHLSNHVFAVRNLRNTKATRVMFFRKCLKINIDLKNAWKNCGNVFCFEGNRIWTDIVKLSVIRTGYFSRPANVLTSRTKILHVNKTDFCQLNWLGTNQWMW